VLDLQGRKQADEGKSGAAAGAADWTGFDHAHGAGRTRDELIF
jgi:hypothetical protein